MILRTKASHKIASILLMSFDFVFIRVHRRLSAVALSLQACALVGATVQPARASSSRRRAVGSLFSWPSARNYSGGRALRYSISTRHLPAPPAGAATINQADEEIYARIQELLSCGIP
jgi:hypothetical protein